MNIKMKGKVPQIKIFEGADISEINQWLIENKIKKIVSISRYPMYDRYDTGKICNQWIETYIIYKK